MSTAKNAKKKKSNRGEDQSFSATYCFKKGDTGHVLGIDFTKNDEQRELIRLMNDNSTPVIFCTGLAGTGKTFATIVAALDLVKIQKKYSKIFYIREPLEVGRSLGYLKGDLDDKYSVYLGGLEDNLENIHIMTGLNKNDMRSAFECIPPQFTRGRSFPINSLIICDESQNFSLDTIQTLSTRIGNYSKIIFLGSVNQIDIRGKDREHNDFIEAMHIFEGIEPPIYAHVELQKSERSEYCRVIDEAFQQYKNENNL